MSVCSRLTFFYYFFIRPLYTHNAFSSLCCLVIFLLSMECDFFLLQKWMEEGQISYYFIKVTMISATMLRFESVLGGFNSVVDGSNDSYLEVSKLPHQKEKKWNGMKWKKRSRRRKSALAFFISRHTRMVFSFLLFLFFFRLYKVTHSDTQVSSSGNFRVLLVCLCMAAWSKM